MLVPVVENEQKLGGVTQTEVRRQRMADETSSVVQAFDALFDFLIVTSHFDQYSGYLAVRRHHDFVHSHQSDARIFQLALDKRSDLFSQRLAAACPKIFL